MRERGEAKKDLIPGVKSRASYKGNKMKRALFNTTHTHTTKYNCDLI